MMDNDEATASFNPYHRWLGIPPKDQPANHYRLLGLPLFEDDFEVVRDAAERQSAHVRRYFNGEYRQYAESLCHEIDEAKRCLLQPTARERYNDELRGGEPLQVGDVFSIYDNRSAAPSPGGEVAFDPYHRWLGVPPFEQPADYYRLLGLARFEDDPDAIRNAAERQIAFVRRYQTGEHAADASKILGELAIARACLLDATRKLEYDLPLHHAAGQTSEPSAARVGDEAPGGDTPAATLRRPFYAVEDPPVTSVAHRPRASMARGELSDDRGGQTRAKAELLDKARTSHPSAIRNPGRSAKGLIVVAQPTVRRRRAQPSLWGALVNIPRLADARLGRWCERPGGLRPRIL